MRYLALKRVLMLVTALTVATLSVVAPASYAACAAMQGKSPMSPCPMARTMGCDVGMTMDSCTGIHNLDVWIPTQPTPLAHPLPHFAPAAPPPLLRPAVFATQQRFNAHSPPPHSVSHTTLYGVFLE